MNVKTKEKLKSIVKKLDDCYEALNCLHDWLTEEYHDILDTLDDSDGPMLRRTIEDTNIACENIIDIASTVEYVIDCNS